MYNSFILDKRFKLHSLIFFAAYIHTCIVVTVIINLWKIEFIQGNYKEIFYVYFIMLGYYLISRLFVYPYRIKLEELIKIERFNTLICTAFVIGSGLAVFQLHIYIVLIFLMQCAVVYFIANCLEYKCSRLPIRNLSKVRDMLHNKDQSMIDIVPGVASENSNFAFQTNTNQYFLCLDIYFVFSLTKINKTKYTELTKENIK